MIPKSVEEQLIIDQAARWGSVREVHTIGDIQIAEVKWCIDGQTRYLIFIDGKDTHRAEESLDAALIYAICYKYDGYNTRAPEYIYRMIGLKEGDNRV